MLLSDHIRQFGRPGGPPADATFSTSNNDENLSSHQ